MWRSGFSLSVCDFESHFMSTGATESDNQPKADAPPSKTPAKGSKAADQISNLVAAKKAAQPQTPDGMLKVKMLTSMAGFHQIPDPENPSKKINGREFLRVPDKDYDVEAEEAARLIEAGYATLVE